MNNNEGLDIFCTAMGIDKDNPGIQEQRIIECFDVLSLMINTNGKYSVDELLDSSGYDSANSFMHRRLSATLRTLLESGIVIRTEEKRKAYYEISNTFKEKLHIVREQKKVPSADKIIEDARVEYSIDDIDFDAEKMDRKALIKYLQHITKLESNLYSFKERYNHLLEKKMKAKLSVFQAEIEAEKTIRAKIKGIEKEIKYLKSKIGEKPVLGNKITIPRPQMPEKPIFSMQPPVEPVYEKPGLFNKKKVEAKNAELKKTYESSVYAYETAKEEFEESVNAFELKMADYEKELEDCKNKEAVLNQEAYEKQLDAYEKNLEKWQDSLDQQRKCLSDIQNNMHNAKEQLLVGLPDYQLKQQIEYELDYLITKIKKTVEVQNKLYSYGVIYGKYRNYVAISSFCDYLISGRCSKLDGSEGAYNLYEQESRADIVICKLDTIISSLEKIQENQYFIYNELKTANMSLAVINDQLLINNVLQVVQLEKLDEIVENTEQTAINTQVGAFYAKKNAELTDALGFMMAL